MVLSGQHSMSMQRLREYYCSLRSLRNIILNAWKISIRKHTIFKRNPFHDEDRVKGSSPIVAENPHGEELALHSICQASRRVPWPNRLRILWSYQYKSAPRLREGLWARTSFGGYKNTDTQYKIHLDIHNFPAYKSDLPHS